MPSRRVSYMLLCKLQLVHVRIVAGLSATTAVHLSALPAVPEAGNDGQTTERRSKLGDCSAMIVDTHMTLGAMSSQHVTRSQELQRSSRALHLHKAS